MIKLNKLMLLILIFLINNSLNNNIYNGYCRFTGGIVATTVAVDDYPIDYSHLIHLFGENLKEDYKPYLNDVLTIEYQNDIEHKMNLFFANRVKQNDDDENVIHHNDKLSVPEMKIKRSTNNNQKKYDDNNNNNTDIYGLADNNNNNNNYRLNGFLEMESIPIDFPKDICLFEINDKIYAAVLHYYNVNMKNDDSKITFTLFKKIDDTFQIVYKYNESAKSMDCKAINNIGYVALVINIEKQQKQLINKGSPIFQITENHIEIVQYFLHINQNKFYLKIFNNDLYLLQTFEYDGKNLNNNNNNNNNNILLCPIYKLSDQHFDRIDGLPCQYAMQIEPFVIDSIIYVAIANYRNEIGSIDTYSFIYQYDVHLEKFQLLQKLHTNAAVDIKYFYIINNNDNNGKSSSSSSSSSQSIIEHFLVVANSGKDQNIPGGIDNNNYDKNSIIYKYDNGFFIPFQNLLLFGIQQFLPIISSNNQFALLISCKNQEIKTFQYNGWKFIESEIQLTGGAFGKGVSNMRTYNLITQNELSIIIIANTEMFGNNTNIFQLKYDAIKMDSIKNPIKNQHKQKWCELNVKKISLLKLNRIAMEIDSINKNNNKYLELNNNRTETTLNIDEIITKSANLSSKSTINENYISIINTLHKKLLRLNEQMKNIEFIHNNNKTNESFKRIINNGDDDDEIHLNWQNTTQFTNHKQIIDEATTESFTTNKRNFDFDLKKNYYDNNSNDYYDEIIVENQLKFEYLNGHHISKFINRTGSNHLQCNEFIINNGIIIQNETLLNELLLKITTNQQSNRMMMMMSRSQEESSEFFDQQLINDIYIKNLTSPIINGMDFSIIYDYALVRHGNKWSDNKHLKNEPEQQPQIIKGNYNFNKLYANEIIIKSNEFIENNMILIDAHSDDDDHTNYYHLEQDVRFVKTLYVNQLNVTKRLNNINVDNQNKLEILLRHSNELQIMHGKIAFDNVILLQPIVLRGKIDSFALDKINPILTINEDLLLQGDFEIMSNVTIKHILKGDNLYGKTKMFNVKNLFEYGLRVNENEITVPIEFMQPIKIGNLIVSQINKKINCKKFIKLNNNFDDIQIITGKKLFLNNLSISNGYCDVHEINGINLQRLNDTILKRNGRNQEISGKIHIRKLIVPSISSWNTLKLFGHDHSRYLAANFENIPENIIVKGRNLIVENNLIIKHLTNNNNNNNNGDLIEIFNYNLIEMLKDTVQENLSQTDDQYDDNITECHQIFGDKIFYGNVTINKLNIINNNIEQQQQQLITNNSNNNIVIIQDSMEIWKKLNVKQLIVKKNINSIEANKFGDNWLINYDDDDDDGPIEQIFTEPQIITNLNVSEIILKGFLNNINIDELYDNVIWTDKATIEFDDVEFDNLIVHDSVTVDGLFAGLKPEMDILLNNTDDESLIQYLPNLTVDQDLYVENDLLIEDTLNGINFNKFSELLHFIHDIQINDNTIIDNLVLHGNINFDIEPEIVNLNDVNLEELYENAWFNGENLIITGNLSIENGIFESTVKLEGLLNGYDTEYIRKNYFSLSSEQDIISILRFKQDVIVEVDTFKCEHLYMDGYIKSFNQPSSTSSSSTEFFGFSGCDGIKIEEFFEKVLRKDADQNITGNWYIFEVILSENIFTTINGLDLKTDVILLNNNNNNNNENNSYYITAKKYFQNNLIIQNLHCEAKEINNGCHLNDINISEWIVNGTYNYGNYTIEGTTTFENIQIYNDVRVFGLVNNVTFNKESILLDNIDQDIYRNVYVTAMTTTTTTPAEHYEDNQDTQFSVEMLTVQETINNRSVAEFLKNLINRQEDREIILDMNIKWLKSLTINNLYNKNDNSLLFNTNVNKIIEECNNEGNNENTEILKKINEYNLILDNTLLLAESHSPIILDYLIHRQCIIGIIEKIISINIYDGDDDEEFKTIFAVLSKDNIMGYVNFYKWSRDLSQLVIDENLLGIYTKDDSEIIDIQSITLYNNEQYLQIQSKNITGINKHTFFKYNCGKFEIIYEILTENITKKLIAFKLNANRSCILSYSKYHKNCFISCDFDNNKEIGFEIYQEFHTMEIHQAFITEIIDNIILILYDIEGNLNILMLNDMKYFELYQVINTDYKKTMDITITSSSSSSNNQNENHQLTFIAICDKPTTTTTDSLNYGSIKIYKFESNLNQSNNLFHYFQTIFIKLPIQIEFSESSKNTDELLLYVLTHERTKSLQIYRYAGISGFISKIQSISQCCGDEPTHFSLLKIQHLQKALLAINSKHDKELNIIEIVSK